MTPVPPPPPAPPSPDFRCGTVVIVGRANAGKSSFLNAVLGETVSVVSPVAQTTRRAIRGVYNAPDLQIVFLDTPGIRAATHRLGSLLNRVARAQVDGADAVCLLLDASAPPQDEDRGWMKNLARDPIPLHFLLNKTDLACRRPLFEDAWRETLAGAASRDSAFTPPPVAWHEISAKTGLGIPALLDALRARMPPAPPLFDPDTLTDDPLPQFIADLIRAQCNQRLAAELPHALAVAVEDFQNPDDPTAPATASATLYVEKPSQRPILLGPKGRQLRAIRRASEKELEAILGKPCRLSLWIEVEPNWSSNYWLLRKFGYLGK